VSRPVVPGNGRRTGPSLAEASAAPAAPDIRRPRDPVPVVRAPEHADAAPRRSIAAARRLLARLVPGRSARTGVRQAVEFDAAARKAYESALRLETGVPLAPAPPAARSAGAPTSAPPTAPVATPAAVPAPAAGPFSLPTTPAATATTAPASEPTTPDAASATAPEPEAAARASAWTTPPRLPAEQSATPGGERPAQSPEESPAPPHRRQPGETAPDFLLRTPPNVAPVADDFFDGIIRRVEGDR
jgi:hypothetical protein